MKGGRIADPVHGYIAFTPLEAALLASPVCQRLRYISQTGLANLVYPEARSTRFAHSLGVMHLSSALLGSALRNATPAVRAEVGAAVRGAVGAAVGATTDPEGLYSELDTSYLDVLQARNFADSDHRAFVAIAEQGLRLAGLFHDLGHLPFSHDFEAALDTYWANLTPAERDSSPIRPLAEPHKGRSAIHETVGHGLALALFRALRVDQFARAAFDVAYRILDAQPLPLERPPETAEDEALRWLHGLIAGEIDADRCDFVLRDGRNYGFEFATYDLSRLLDNVTAVARDGKFALAVEARGISAVESFLMARYRSYQLAVRHHKVAQVGAALRHCTARRLGDGSTQQLLADIGSLAAAVLGTRLDDAEGILRRFPTYDDVWWFRELRDESLGNEEDEWLALICWRRAGIVSMWKRTEHLGGYVDSIPDWNARLDRMDPRDWHPLAARMLDQGVLLVRHAFKPWTANVAGESELAFIHNDGLVPVSVASPLIRSLRDAWMEEPHVQAFRTSTSAASIDTVISALGSASEE